MTTHLCLFFLKHFLTVFTLQNTLEQSKRMGHMYFNIKKQKYLVLVVSYRAYYEMPYCLTVIQKFRYTSNSTADP